MREGGAPPGPLPLEAMPPAVARGLLGLAFDVDDTVTEGGRLRSEALGAMERLAEAGLRLVAVTGRPLGWAEAIASQWPVRLAVAENGAGWRWRDGAGRLRGGSLLRGAEAEAARHRLRRAAERIEARLGLPRADDQAGRRWDEAFEAPSEPATLAALRAEAEREGLGLFVSSVHAHLAAGWDKARGLRAGCEACFEEPFEPARWLFVGDGLNDAPLFSALPHTVGVANVAEVLGRLPRPPRWICRAPRAAGFAELAERLLRLRTGG